MQGFFENVGKLVTEKSRQAVSRASDLTELASIKNEISSLEKSIRANYEAIGELYYEVDGKDPHNLFAVRCQSITEMQERIAELERLAEGVKNRSVSPDMSQAESVAGVLNQPEQFTAEGNEPTKTTATWDDILPENNDF